MANIENIAVKTNTLKPNGIIVGNITNTNGILSNFAAYSYFEIPGGRVDNSEYVIKFTMPSALPTETKVIAHSEYWEALQCLTTGEIYVYDWGGATNRILIASPTLGATYWVKSVHSGTTRTYYTSTDGTNYTQVVSFTDSSVDVTKSYIYILGNSSLIMTSQTTGRQWTGTIDLNGCYIKVNGNIIWNGMDYNDIQRVGGDEFNGQWIDKSYTISSSYTLAPDAKTTFSLSSYLPNDDYDYEVQFENLVTTGSTSGDYLESYLHSGSTTSSFYNRTCRERTRDASTQIGSMVVILPILNSDRNITSRSYSGSINTSTLALYAKKYRRIGKNGTSANYISSINYSNSSYPIYGKFIDGDWVYKSTTLFSGTLEQNVSTTISLSSYLPNDGYFYEVLCNVTANTGATSGNTVAIRLGTSTTLNNNPQVCRRVTRTASTMMSAGNIIIPVGARNLYVGNAGNATSGTVTVYGRGYRRIGTND